MHVRTNPCSSLAFVTALLVAAGCGSSDSAPRPDASSDVVVPAPDGRPAGDTPAPSDTAIAGPDTPAPADVAMETGGIGVDASILPVEAGGAGLDAAGSEGGGGDIAGGNWDAGTAGIDSPAAGADVRHDSAPDGFSPGPATPIVVNSANTGVYSLGDGTWKVFYFDAAAGQLYCISDLSGIVHGYVSTSPAVSPTFYQYTTSADGTLAFTAATAQRYYIAVGVSGGGASGSFQVADGGQLLNIGANTVTLAAIDGDNTYFFRFPVSAGQSYSLSAAGQATTSVGLGLSPRAERASNGQFSVFLRSISGPLPFNDEIIPDTSVALSYSGYYFFFLHVYQAVTLTVTLTQTS